MLMILEIFLNNNESKCQQQNITQLSTSDFLIT